MCILCYLNLKWKDSKYEIFNHQTNDIGIYIYIYHIREPVEQRYRQTNKTRGKKSPNKKRTYKIICGSIKRLYFFNSNCRKANVHFQRQDDFQEIFRGQSDAEFPSRADPKNYNTASTIRGLTNVFLMHAVEQTIETPSQNAIIMENLGEKSKHS